MPRSTLLRQRLERTKSYADTYEVQRLPQKLDRA